MRKILIVDDLSSFIEREKCILNRSDFIIFTATSSADALAIHRAERVDLMVIDLDMPGTPGDALCTLIRKDETLKKVPIIIVCTSGKRDLERVERCKANGYVTKPIKPVQFIEKVSQLLDVPERKSYRVLLKVTVTGTTSAESFFCSSHNISSSGMLIETDKSLAKGCHILCSFFLPNSARVFTSAEVVREVNSEVGGINKYGIHFLDLDPAHKAAIEAFVKSGAAAR